jgi:hypothetical protein
MADHRIGILTLSYVARVIIFIEYQLKKTVFNNYIENFYNYLLTAYAVIGGAIDNL